MINVINVAAYCQGIRKLLKEDFSGFNANILNREAAIRKALSDCAKIEIVIAHTGDGITNHAAKAVADVIAEQDGVEFRLNGAAFDFDAAKSVAALHSVQVYEQADCRLTLFNFGSETQPRTAFYGTIALTQLADLHKQFGKALYEKNIRTFLGRDTPLNAAIRDTLAERPDHFQYLMPEGWRLSKTKRNSHHRVVHPRSAGEGTNGRISLSESGPFAALTGAGRFLQTRHTATADLHPTHPSGV